MNYNLKSGWQRKQELYMENSRSGKRNARQCAVVDVMSLCSSALYRVVLTIIRNTTAVNAITKENIFTNKKNYSKTP